MSDPADYYDLSRVRPEVVAVLTLINEIGRESFSPRAKAIDDDASFPVENYKDLAAERFPLTLHCQGIRWLRLLDIEYAMVGAEIGKYCGATALTFNMHNSSMAWSRFMFDCRT